MPTIEIPDTCEFELIAEDSIKLETQTNGDRITLFAELTKEQAATLAYLANMVDDPIIVEIKQKEV